MDFASLLESLDKDIEHQQNLQSGCGRNSISSPELVVTKPESPGLERDLILTNARQEKDSIPLKINDNIVMISQNTNAFDILFSKFKLDASENALWIHLSSKLSRPLRHWEIITEVLESTDDKASFSIERCLNVFLEAKSLRGKFPKIQGWCHILFKNKWTKVFLHLAESTLNYYNDGSELPHLLAHLSDWDVYTVNNQISSPYPYVFALSSTHSLDYFEKKSEGIKYFCVEKQERVGDWTKAISAARNEKMWIERPNLFAKFAPLIDEKAVQRLRSRIAPPSVCPH